MEVREKLPLAGRIWARPRCHDTNRYYHYHRDHGHDMEEFIQLQDEIKSFMHEGRLN